ncbi:unnamed protein product, partial [Schistosoma curassoni]|uniref:Ovule protein n=1 Tax=Schistosoma curassoni TaxID=6186 RepID=A0A183L0U8_9TREM
IYSSCYISFIIKQKRTVIKSITTCNDDDSKPEPLQSMISSGLCSFPMNKSIAA